MPNNQSNNKRIAKNTILLYGRMLLMMLISLYTSRVILNALGIVDYGIYNVVGGVVSLFSILSNSLSAAISRFITFQLGQADVEKLKKVFCTSVNVQLILIGLITILLETVGVWFLNNKMVIPAERLTAANWVFQFSVITFAVNLWSVPYNASIIAHERMSAFAYITIFDATAKLLISFIILKNPIDRLVYYSILVLIIGIMQRMIYTWYCKKHFVECNYSPIFDKPTTKEIFEFAGWNFIGSSASILSQQGVSLILNLFFGPVVNAARGIAMTVNGVVTGFVSNFMMALNPQITKSYAANDYNYMLKLAFQGARFSFYILLMIVLPLIFCIHNLLIIWLGEVPKYTDIFTTLVLLYSLHETLSGTLVTVMLATGKIRNYQLVVGGILLLNLPVSYLFLYLGFEPYIVFVVSIILAIAAEFARVFMLREMVNLSARAFITKVYANVFIVAIVSAVAPFILTLLLDSDDFFSNATIAFVAFLSALLSIYLVGCNRDERNLIKDFVSTKILKMK